MKRPRYAGDPTRPSTCPFQGTVILEATIDETGVVRDVKVLRSMPLLDEAANNAVAQWRYSPTTLNDVAVPVV